MSRLRVLDIAKELKLDTKTVIAKLQDLGIQVKNHFNAISDLEADKLRAYVRSGKNPEKEAAAKPASKVVIRRRADATSDAPGAGETHSAGGFESSAEPPLSAAPVEAHVASQVETPVQERAAAQMAPSVAEAVEPSSEREPAPTTQAAAETTLAGAQESKIQSEQTQTAKQTPPPSTGGATIVRPAAPAVSATIIRRAEPTPPPTSSAGGPRPYSSGPVPAGQRPSMRDGGFGGPQPRSDRNSYQRGDQGGYHRPDSPGGFSGPRPQDGENRGGWQPRPAGAGGGPRPAGAGGGFGGPRPAGAGGGFGGPRPAGAGGGFGGPRPGGPSAGLPFGSTSD
ncbi:MAG: hypothetical protein RL189_1403, partial [Pseudomonadota bacterium]